MAFNRLIKKKKLEDLFWFADKFSREGFNKNLLGDMISFSPLKAYD